MDTVIEVVKDNRGTPVSSFGSGVERLYSISAVDVVESIEEDDVFL